MPNSGVAHARTNFFNMRPTFLRHKSKSSTQWLSRQSRDHYVKKRLLPSLGSSTPSQSSKLDESAERSAPELGVQYRARSAFKLIEINAHPTLGGFLDHEDVNSVVDLGAAPGGWIQVVAAKFGWLGAPIPGVVSTVESPEATDVSSEQGGASELEEHSDDQFDYLQKKKFNRKKPKKTQIVEELTNWDPLNVDDILPNMARSTSNVKGRGTIIAVDLLPMQPIPGVQTICGDFLDPQTSESIQALLSRRSGRPFAKSDVILSDLAANSMGNTAHDIQSSLSICETVLQFARWNLRSADDIGRKRGGVLL